VGTDRRWILAENRRLRLFTLFILYVAQGVPLGLFWFAIPAWMAANGADAALTLRRVIEEHFPDSVKKVAVLDFHTGLRPDRLWRTALSRLTERGLRAGPEMVRTGSHLHRWSFCRGRDQRNVDFGDRDRLCSRGVPLPGLEG